jgi:ketosteroid isomerase-like protein
MVTIRAGSVLDPAVHELFEGLRTYDAARAAKVLAEDADWEWQGGKMTGKAAVEQFLQGWLKDPKTRPSFSIIDVAGDGAITRLTMSVSGRFGQAPQRVTMHVLCLKHVVHHVKLVNEGVAKGH